MNAKQKADELIGKLLPSMYCYMGSGMLSNTYDEFVALDNAKRCAIISADAALYALSVSPIENKEYSSYDSQVDYWNLVKHEIEQVNEFPA